MSQFRDLIARMAIDAEFARHARAHPDLVAQQYGLTNDEAEQLRGLADASDAAGPVALGARLSKMDPFFNPGVITLADYDHDGIPDVLDNDDDNDGIKDNVDANPKHFDFKVSVLQPVSPIDLHLDWGDPDGDGKPNWQDTDDDGDGIPDNLDPTPKGPIIKLPPLLPLDPDLLSPDGGGGVDPTPGGDPTDDGPSGSDGGGSSEGDDDDDNDSAGQQPASDQVPLPVNQDANVVAAPADQGPTLVPASEDDGIGTEILVVGGAGLAAGIIAGGIAGAVAGKVGKGDEGSSAAA